MSTWCMKFSPRMTAVSPKSCSPTTSMRQFLRTSLPMANSSIDTVSTAVSPPIPNMRSVRLPCRTRPRRSAAPRRISVCVAPVSIPMPTFWPLIAPSTTTCSREDRTGHSATRTSVHFAGAAWADSPATIVAVASAVDHQRHPDRRAPHDAIMRERRSTHCFGCTHLRARPGRRIREDGAALVGEIHLALAVRDEHAMRAQEVGAEQHVRPVERFPRHVAPWRHDRRILPQVGEPEHADRERARRRCESSRTGRTRIRSACCQGLRCSRRRTTPGESGVIADLRRLRFRDDRRIGTRIEDRGRPDGR